MAEKKLDIFRVLSALDNRNKDFWDTLTDEEKREFSAWLVMRWASCTHSHTADYIIMVNELVNKHFVEMYRHPELHWKLMAAAGIGKTVKHVWIKPPNQRKQDKINEFLQTIYPHYDNKDIELVRRLNSIDNLKQMARENGLPEKEINDIWGK